MRAPIAFVLALLLAAPAHAQVDSDFGMANRIFGQVSPASVVEDIAGEWLPLSTLSNLNGAEAAPGLAASFLERFCGNEPARGAVISPIDEASFEMVGANSGGELVYRFDWIRGAQFHRSFDAETLFRVLRLDTMEGERGAEIRGQTLEATSSLVDLYRVSPDVITMATPQRVEIFARCAQ